MASTLKDIDPEDEAQVVSKYGKPRRTHFSADFREFECNLVKQSTSKGRFHDITCFIRYDDKFVGIQKHAYADTGIYRAPSGGSNIGESIESAALREMHEETGFRIRLLRYVLDSRLDVVCEDGTIPWRSLVFLAEIVDGEMNAIDTSEIYDVKTVTRDEMLGPICRLMEESGWGGFLYRAHLTRRFFEALDSPNLDGLF